MRSTILVLTILGLGSTAQAGYPANANRNEIAAIPLNSDSTGFPASRPEHAGPPGQANIPANARVDYSGPAGTVQTAIPEPLSVLLFGAGALIVGAAVRRRPPV